MPRFFVNAVAGEDVVITGEDAAHISRSLRMREGERLTVCDGTSDHSCVIRMLSPDAVYLRVEDSRPTVSEPNVRVTLYQGYPKGDKLETVMQKAVELGVGAVVPVVTSRSVARPDDKSAKKRLERWQRISLEAAKQSGRGRVPEIGELCDFRAMLSRVHSHGLFIYCYENGGQPLSRLLAGSPSDIGLFIGPEGGISAGEADALDASGAFPATLGSRILRTETAPVAALAVIMALTGNLE